MTAPQPPTREPYFSGNEFYGWALRDCAKGLIQTLTSWCAKPLDFKGDANGRVWHFMGDHADRAQLLFTSDRGDGTIELSVDDSHWVRAEVTINGELVLRAWLDEPYEEKEFWPDGADGVVPPDGDAPGRISKRGAWLIIRCADFPGVPDGGEGYWRVEDTYD